MFAIPIGTTRPQRRVPWVNYAIIAANILIFLLTHTTVHAPNGATAMGLAPWCDKYMLIPVATPRIADGQQVLLQPALIQYITYQFLHVDWMHLLGNMAFLYVFGNALNEKIGHLSYLAFYLAGGVLAGIGQALTYTAPTLGASGSISAVTGLFLVLLPRIDIKLFVFLFFYMDVFLIPSMWFILFAVAMDIIDPFLGSSEVAHMAHLAGSVSGIGMGFLLLATGLVQRDHYDMLSLITRWRRRKQYEALVSHGFDPFAGAAVTPGAPPMPILDPRIATLRDEISALLHTHNTPSAAAKYLELRQVDPRQVLAQQDQLDVANQLMSESKYEAAASAYEDYLRLYRTAPHAEQVELILGLIYARYVPRADRAAEMLKGALTRLHDAGQRALAEETLAGLSGAQPT